MHKKIYKKPELISMGSLKTQTLGNAASGAPDMGMMGGAMGGGMMGGGMMGGGMMGGGMAMF